MKFECNVIQSRPLGESYHLLTMVHAKDYYFAAGQYVRMFFEDEHGSFDRFYSIANAPNPDRQIQFCVQLNDRRVKPILQRLNVGDQQTISAAAGSFRLIDDERPVILVAGGSGISPIRSFFFQMTGGLRQPPDRHIHLVYGCRSGDAIPGKEEFLDYQQKYNDKFTMWLVAESKVTPPLSGGRVTDVLAAALLPGARIYVCGPAPMIAAVRTSLVQQGVRTEDILQDPF